MDHRIDLDGRFGMRGSDLRRAGLISDVRPESQLLEPDRCLDVVAQDRPSGVPVAG